MWSEAVDKCKEDGGQLMITPDRDMIRFFRKDEIASK